MSERVSPTQWCDTGLALLRDEGMPALTIERLCAALQRTKGSFYHHFRDMQAFQEALLCRWEETLTDGPMRAAATEQDPKRRAARLDAAVTKLDHRLDLAVRAWGLWDRRARAAVERVDTRRLAYVTDLYQARGAADANALAQLEYFAFVGYQQVGAFVAPTRAARMRGDVQRLLARVAQGKRASVRAVKSKTRRSG